MTDKRNSPQWLIKVGGSQLANVLPGESVEIGRRPIRPLHDDGRARVEIDDDARSVSKRHMVFTVADDGAATVTDLGSTNGTYRFDGHGGLVGLTANSPFTLPQGGTWIQLGDVPVQFVPEIREQESDDGKPEVGDLFDFAGAAPQQEPEMGEVSVEDILNLRAGEPTRVFDASEVVKKAHVDASDAPTANKPADAAGHARSESDAQQAPQRDGLPPADHHNSAAVSEHSDHSRPSQTMKNFSGASASSTSTPDGSARLVDHISVNVAADIAKQPQERDLFQDAIQNAVGAESEESSAAQQQRVAHTAFSAQQPSVSSHDVGVPGTQPSQQSSVASLIPGRTVSGRSDDQANAQSAVLKDGGAGGMQNASQEHVSTEHADTANSSLYPGYGAADAQQADQTGVFEPGSIFDKVSKGEFDHPQEIVEEDGLNSQDAAKTTDFSLQFEMARHRSLLPFLAMNPYLYADLYTWLSAQGDADIDAALMHNTGYEQYRASEGNGRSQ